MPERCSTPALRESGRPVLLTSGGLVPKRMRPTARLPSVPCSCSTRAGVRDFGSRLVRWIESAGSVWWGSTSELWEADCGICCLATAWSPCWDGFARMVIYPSGSERRGGRNPLTPACRGVSILPRLHNPSTMAVHPRRWKGVCSHEQHISLDSTRRRAAARRCGRLRGLAGGRGARHRAERQDRGPVVWGGRGSLGAVPVSVPVLRLAQALGLRIPLRAVLLPLLVPRHPRLVLAPRLVRRVRRLRTARPLRRVAPAGSRA